MRKIVVSEFVTLDGVMEAPVASPGAPDVVRPPCGSDASRNVPEPANT
jgi:hypothetical protein